MRFMPDIRRLTRACCHAACVHARSEAINASTYWSRRNIIAFLSHSILEDDVWLDEWKRVESVKLKKWIDDGYDEEQYKETTKEDFFRNKKEKQRNRRRNALYSERENILDLDCKWKGSLTSYKEYLDTLSDSDRESKLKYVRYNTFLVFHSGKIIQSGLSADFMRDDFYEFCDIINKAYAAGQLEETLIDE